MVVLKVENEASKTTTVCGTSSGGKPKFRNKVCTTTPQKACTRTTEYKSTHSKYCCSCNEKEWNKRIIKSTGKLQGTSMKKKIPPPKVLTKEEYNQYKELCPMTKEEKEKVLKMQEEERQRLLKESMERKEEFRRLDRERPRVKDPKLIEIEEEARKRTNYLLERAENLKLEQEEEIQKCNRIILETKCRAIRDAQVAEKKLIEQELGEEEKRLNDMMENERRWAIKEEFRKEQEEIAKKEKFANSLMDQIKDNEDYRILEFERKQEESRLINLSNIAWQQEEIAKLRNKETENTRIRRELAEVNEQLKHLKEMEVQENKIIDLRIQEYQQYKEERDAHLAEERRLEKLRKDQAKAKVASQTMQAKDFQERIDELNAARIQEEVEREWRQKEKEEALRRAEVQKALKEEREKQINNKRIMQAIELERERREFEKIVHVQKEAFCREQKEIEKKQRQALIHRSEILKQVNEKEKGRIEARQKMFEEGLAIRTKTEMRKKKLREAMERKCDEMRINKMPEMYINEVKRMIDNIE
ncbi:cilia- and flagella-associated protein 45-like [Osmia bicornis bicornis]|uniref:cilia- and flagella-associated protein 45-like n=1 Tax=Osmia bicornis bicornis TaxID=1437191 RepID=UPI001EAEEADB|nr:cilia- and flagella-associated protein 45-like [Osmia bicornis bicornis]